MMAKLIVTEHRLASGHMVRVAVITPERFRVLPCMEMDPPADEIRLALELGQARLGMPLAPVPPASRRMVPVEVAGSLRLSPRSAPRMGVACAPLRLLRTVAGGLRQGEFLVNAAYFLFLPQELQGPFDAYGDPVGLSMTQGLVHTPPQLPRACLLMTAQGPAIQRIGFADIGLRVATGAAFTPHPFGPPVQTGYGAAFALFHGSVAGLTPQAGQFWDVAFVGRHAVAIQPGGGIPIPRAGCVLRCASAVEAETLAATPLTYDLPLTTEAVQAGPMIVASGAITEQHEDVFARELMSQTAARPDTVHVSPHGWAADWHQTRAARLSAGITASGNLFFIAVEGSSSFYRDACAKGATLHDLAVLMVEHGAVSALHLDGGGSAQVFCAGGGAILSPRDVHHAMPDSPAQFDRPLPLGLVLS